jgi:hypothetical protein
MGVQSATMGSHRANASIRQIFDAMPAGHELTEDEVGHAVVGLWEADILYLAGVAESGALLFRFADPEFVCG